jgi:hypothetical protein
MVGGEKQLLIDKIRFEDTFFSALAFDNSRGPLPE